eukprot:UN28548
MSERLLRDFFTKISKNLISLMDSAGWLERTGNLGWHCVLVNTVVRQSPDMNSQVMTNLKLGSKVFVCDDDLRRRVQISKPVKGWVSKESADGITILTPMDDNENGGGKINNIGRFFDNLVDVWKHNITPGKYEVVLDVRVRELKDLNSENVKIIKRGSLLILVKL